jgi:hypothetical protein
MFTMYGGAIFLMMESCCIFDSNLAVRRPLGILESNQKSTNRKLMKCKKSTLLFLKRIRRNVNVFVYEEIIQKFLSEIDDDLAI